MRIFVDPEMLAAGELSVHGDEHHYLARVRRARVGDAVEIVDGAGKRAAAEILRIGDAETVLRVEEPTLIVARPPLVRALIPPIKGDRMDACLEKLVEVGVDEIVVWPAARSIVRLDGERKEARLAKYQLVLQAAARQCGRAQVPAISFARELAAAIAALPDGIRVVLDPSSSAPLSLPETTDVTVISGPEGGFTTDELDALGRADFLAAGLGPRVLRAETAPMVAVALIRAATRS